MSRYVCGQCGFEFACGEPNCPLCGSQRRDMDEVLADRLELEDSLESEITTAIRLVRALSPRERRELRKILREAKRPSGAAATTVVVEPEARGVRGTVSVTEQDDSLAAEGSVAILARQLEGRSPRYRPVARWLRQRAWQGVQIVGLTLAALSLGHGYVTAKEQSQLLETIRDALPAAEQCETYEEIEEIIIRSKREDES